MATLNTGNSTTLQNVELGTDYTDQAATIVANLAKRPGQQYLLEVGNSAGDPSTVVRQWAEGRDRFPIPTCTW